MMQQPESEERANSEAAPEVTEKEDIESLKQALAEEKAKAESYLSNWQRAQADFINYRRRTEQEKGELNSLPMLISCSASCLSLMTWNGPLLIFHLGWPNFPG